MKKFMFVAVLLLTALTIKAEIVAKDTVEYTGAWRMEKIEKTNDYGEVSVRYVAYLEDVTNAKGKPRKVPTDKGTYLSDDLTHIVYNVYDTGARRIAKAININEARDRQIVAGKKKETAPTK